MWIIEEIRSGESGNMEFKRELPSKSEKYIKTLVAYANSSGGKLIIGVEDESGKIVGVDENELFSLIDRITNAISDTVTPQLIPNITSAVIDGKTILIIEVFPGAARPYYITSMGMENGTYIKVNATTRHADAIMLKELQLQGRNQSYDETVIPDRPLDEAAVEKLCNDIKHHIDEAVKARGETSLEKEITPVNLENWNIIKRKDNKLYPTIAFDLLTTNTQRFAKVQCGLFKGNDRVVFLDKREYGGPIYEQIEEAYQFVLKHINLGMEIDGIYRKEVYEIPPSAIREAIANAVTHRNYMDNACVQVCVYDDRVEITSPGMLFGGLTIDMIKNGSTRIRNAGIAEVFGRMYVIEGWGTGIKRMIDACREYGLPDPAFTELGTNFRVEFFRKNVAGVGVNVGVNVGVKLSATQKKILDAIERDSRVTNVILSESLGVTTRTIERNMSTLKKKGIIERIGSDKDGSWQIVK